jgi:hypothetical protein
LAGSVVDAAAHQIALQTWWMLSFFCTPLSLAAQAIIPREMSAGRYVLDKYALAACHVCMQRAVVFFSSWQACGIYICFCGMSLTYVTHYGFISCLEECREAWAGRYATSELRFSANEHVANLLAECFCVTKWLQCHGIDTHECVFYSELELRAHWSKDWLS